MIGKSIQNIDDVRSELLHILFIAFDGPSISGPPSGHSLESKNTGIHNATLVPIFHGSGTG